LAKFGYPLLAGTSRKGFLGATLARNGRPAPPEERLQATAATRQQFTRGAVHRRDSSTLIESGLEEHLQLESKSVLYEDNDRGRREFTTAPAAFCSQA